MTHFIKTIPIQKGINNQVFFNYPADLSDKTVKFRFKKKKEDQSDPLIEGNATIISTSEVRSECFFYLDLSQSDILKELIGQAWIDFVITFEGDICPIVLFPTEVNILTTLKQGY
jgi:hypothetical protein